MAQNEIGQDIAGKNGSAFHKADDSENVLRGKESYRFTPSRQFVARSVKLNESQTKSMRLKVAERNNVSRNPHTIFDYVFLRSKTRQYLNGESEIVRGADLFCGCGGLSLGLNEACLALEKRFKSIWAVDKDRSSLDVYVDNFAPENFINENIENVLCGKLGTRLEETEIKLKRQLGRIDIGLAGPPCQGNSNLNNHTRRKDQRNKLYERVARFAEVIQPNHLIVENVPTVIHGRDKSLDTTIERLLKLGYKVDAGIVDLSDLGVPQKRKRHVLIASLEKSISLKSIMRSYKVLENRTVRWAIEGLEQEGNNIFQERAKLSEENEKRIKYLFEKDEYNLPNYLRPVCHQNDEHSYGAMYGRLKYDESAQTITTGFMSPGQGRYIHPSRQRTLTPHEAARLQFFPDFFDFTLAKSKTNLKEMIGNAVPMPLSYVFALELLAE
jgi:DNA (cytosine-5)-methyltransferase 1